jgi:hypothetical protein
MIQRTDRPPIFSIQPKDVAKTSPSRERATVSGNQAYWFDLGQSDPEHGIELIKEEGPDFAIAINSFAEGLHPSDFSRIIDLAAKALNAQQFTTLWTRILFVQRGNSDVVKALVSTLRDRANPAVLGSRLPSTSLSYVLDRASSVSRWDRELALSAFSRQAETLSVAEFEKIEADYQLKGDFLTAYTTANFEGRTMEICALLKAREGDRYADEAAWRLVVDAPDEAVMKQAKKLAAMGATDLNPYLMAAFAYRLRPVDASLAQEWSARIADASILRLANSDSVERVQGESRPRGK